MRLAAAICAMAAFAAPAPAVAQNISGNQFIEFCTATDIGLENGCIGYVTGLYDALSLYNVAPDTVGIPWRFCAPSRVDVVQLRDIFLAHVDRRPADRHISMSALAVHALAEAWPCP